MKVTSIFVISLLLFLSYQPVYADSVVLNELMPHPSSGSDWIEIYNPTVNSIDLSNWTLVDRTSVMKTLSGVIEARGLMTFDVTNRLNNSGDSIYLKDFNGNEVDNYSYYLDPGINKSFGRTPDGGTWTMLISSSKGSNNGEESIPTPTPTPKPTVKPSPTATPAPTKTVISTPNISPTVNPSVLASEGPSFAWARRIASSSAYRVASVAGATATMSAESSTSATEVEVKNQKQTNPLIWVGSVFILIGLGSIGYIYLKRNGKIRF